MKAIPLKKLKRIQMIGLNACKAWAIKIMRSLPRSKWTQTESPCPGSTMFVAGDEARFLYPGESYQRCDGVVVQVQRDGSVRRITRKPVSRKAARNMKRAALRSENIRKNGGKA